MTNSKENEGNMQNEKMKVDYVLKTRSNNFFWSTYRVTVNYISIVTVKYVHFHGQLYLEKIHLNCTTT